MESAASVVALTAEVAEKVRRNAEKVERERLCFWTETILPLMTRQFFERLKVERVIYTKAHFMKEQVSFSLSYSAFSLLSDVPGAPLFYIELLFNSGHAPFLADDLTREQLHKISETVALLGWTLLSNEKRDRFRFVDSAQLRLAGLGARGEGAWMYGAFATWPFNA